MANKVQVLIHEEFTPIINLTFLLNISYKITMSKIEKDYNIKDQSQ